MVDNAIDPRRLKTDDLILVSHDGNTWIPRYFAKFDMDIIFCYKDGRTSKTARNTDNLDVQPWFRAKKYVED